MRGPSLTGRRLKISVNEARAYWSDRSQQIGGITPETLPDVGFEYWADGPICGVFHPAAWPGVWMAHYGAKPEGRGRFVDHARRILCAFWEAHDPARVIGWTHSNNRAALAFAKRIGFQVDGRFPVQDGEIIMTGWVK